MWSGKCPVGEMSVRGNVQSGKCPVGEMSSRGSVRSGKFPSGKCQSGNCRRGTVRIPWKTAIQNILTNWQENAFIKFYFRQLLNLEIFQILKESFSRFFKTLSGNCFTWRLLRIFLCIQVMFFTDSPAPSPTLTGFSSLLPISIALFPP